MGLCVGEVGRPRWLALTEGTLSWSMPTGLRFMSFILEKRHQSETETEQPARMQNNIQHLANCLSALLPLQTQLAISRHGLCRGLYVS